MATLSLKALEKSELYSEQLGIHLSEKEDKEYFKWFLASILFGGRISEAIARNTYFTFERYGLLEPQRILEAGWDFLVNPIMREGGYVRYDGRKSTQILRNCQTLIDQYGGSLQMLHKLSTDNSNLEQRLDAFYGVGPVTVNIFLRELRPFWSKANPEPLSIAFETAKSIGLDLSRFNRKTVKFARIEAGLIRLKHTRVHPIK